MCREPGPPASLCRDASVLGQSEADGVEYACMKAGQLRRSGAARIAKGVPGEERAEKFPSGRHARVQDCPGAPWSRPCSPRMPSGMPSDQGLAAPAASPTQRAWAEAGRSVLAIPRRGCFRACEAYRGCFGSQEADAGIQEADAGTQEAEAESQEAEAESQGEGPAVHAVPSSQLYLHQAGMTRICQVRYKRSEDQEAVPAFHHAVPSSWVDQH